MFRKVKRKPAPRVTKGKCSTPECRHKRPFKRSKKTPQGFYLSYCWKCQSRMLKARHHETYTLNLLRGAARRRGIPFEITLEEWRHWCRATGYLELKGREPHSMTVDRIDPRRGYSLDNIRTLSHAENSARRDALPEEPF